MKTNGLFFLLLFWVSLFSCGTKKITAPGLPPVVMETTDNISRGFNLSSHVTAQDIADLKQTGANLVRVVFGYYKLISKNPPYQYNEEEFANLDRILSLCEKYNMRVVVNPHTVPGLTSSDYTASPDDPFWTDASYQDILVNLWKKLSDRYKNRGSVIFGYDLLNEPFVPNDPQIWNNLVAKLTRLIRDNGDKHPIIVEAFGLRDAKGWHDRIDNLSNLKLPVDDSLIVSPHFYDPLKYTHQTVIAGYGPISYNDPAVGGKAALEKNLQPIVDFQNAHPGVRIFLGEFSVARIATDGDQYIKDAIDFFEKNKWHWAYHSFREAYVWDAEMPLGSNEKAARSATASRMTLLKTYFKKNKQ